MEEKDEKIRRFMIYIRYHLIFLYKIKNEYYFIGGKIFERCLDQDLIKTYDEYVNLYSKFADIIECEEGKYKGPSKELLKLLDSYNFIINKSIEKENEVDKKYHDLYKKMSYEKKCDVINKEIYNKIEILKNNYSMDKISEEYNKQLKRNFGNIYYINDRNKLEKYLQNNGII